MSLAFKFVETWGQKFIDDILGKITDEDEMKTLLKGPYREVSFEIPIRGYNGKLKVFKGYRVQHDNSRGPFKGGFRFHTDLSLDHFRDLAAVMSWKTSLLNLPFGGAKGGVDCNPQELSRSEKEQITKKYTERIEPLIGPDLDIMAPDMGTGPQEMAWVLEAYSKYHGYEPAVVTGKPVELGGSHLRTESTGYGVAFITKLMLENLKMDCSNAHVAIHGFGKVGVHLARHLHELGAKVIAVCSSKRGVFNAAGLDIPSLTLGEKSNLDEQYSGYEPISPDDLLCLDVDVLIPASMEGVITDKNVEDINCGLIVEAANLPLTYEADKILQQRGVHIVPDILANGGGVTVSYLEWLHANEGSLWSEEQQRSKFLRIMEEAFSTTVQRARQESLSLREAAYLTAVERVKRAIEMRGN